MKVLILKGSPRKGKNTDTLTEAFIKGISTNPEVQITSIRLSEKNISPCRACGYCETKKGCVINDDMQMIYSHIQTSPIIALATPVYFNNVTAFTKIMIDRCQMYYSNKYKLMDPNIPIESNKKMGIVLSTGGSEYKNQFEGLRSTCELFFKAIHADYEGELFVPRTDKESVANRKDILRQSEQFGKEMIERFSTR